MEAGIHELAAGYALDALDDADRADFEEHLPGCERCREEVASFEDVGAALAIASSGPEPRPELRDRILEAARAERQNVVPFRPRRQGLVPALAAATAVAAAVAIGVAVWAASLSGRLDDTRSALAARERTQAVLADPAARTVALEAGQGRVVVGGGGRAVLVLDQVDRAASGKTYEAWVIEGGTPKRAGLFVGGGRAVVPLEIPVSVGAVVAATLEPGGGVDAPTSKPFAASSPV